ncbi:MAG: T9SS type A sorting domain-containing protein [FCB group bacterium]|jgi:photosystem II stability/assembly factor-like uncharacterized protein
MKNVLLPILLVLFSLLTLNAQWEHANGGKTLPDSTAINGLYANGSSLYAGTAKGVYISTNNGDSWLSKNSGLKGIDVYSFLVVDNTILAGTSSGIYTSADNGSSWVSKPSGMNGESVNNFLKIGNLIFIGTSGGIFSSGDNGNNWTTANNGITDPGFTEIYALAMKGSAIFAGTSAGLYVSTDNGSSWYLRNQGLDITSIYSLIVSKKGLFISGENFDEGVYYSTDYGNTWVQKNSGLFPAKDAHYSLIAVGDSVLAGGNKTGVYMTADNGDTWNPFVDGLSAWILLNDLQFTKNDNYVFVSSKGESGFCNVWRRSLQYSAPEPTITGVYSVCYNNIYNYSTTQIQNYVYKWNITGGNIIGTNILSSVKVQWTSANTGNLHVVVTNSLTGDSGTCSQNITINKLPVPVINGKQCTIRGCSEDYTTKITQGSIYKWCVSSGTINGADSLYTVNITWAHTDSGSVKLIETNANACIDSVSMTVELLPDAVNDLIIKNNSFSIFPNPADENLTIEINNNKNENYIEILDLLGTTVLDYYSHAQIQTINIGTLAKGVYFIRIGDQTKMLVKE